jgi:hypothetical protein
MNDYSTCHDTKLLFTRQIFLKVHDEDEFFSKQDVLYSKKNVFDKIVLKKVFPEMIK